MENFKKSKNQLWKESNSSLTFKEWLDREVLKGNFPQKELGVDGKVKDDLDTTKFEDTLGIESHKFEDVIGLNKPIVETRNKNLVFGLNKWILVSSVLIIGGVIAYKFYNKKR